MERNEFNEWLQKHQKAYPALADWFSTLPDLKGTLQIWFDTMKFVSKAHADEATMRMMRGVEPLVRYTNWHDTPRFVYEHAQCLTREAAPRKKWVLPEANGEEIFKCLQCHDTGVLQVFHGQHVRMVRKGNATMRCIHSSARACSCEAAKKYSHMTDRGDLPVFNPVTDVPVPMDRPSCSARSFDNDVAIIMDSCCDGAMSLDEWAQRQ